MSGQLPGGDGLLLLGTQFEKIRFWIGDARRRREQVAETRSKVARQLGSNRGVVDRVDPQCADAGVPCPGRWQLSESGIARANPLEKQRAAIDRKNEGINGGREYRSLESHGRSVSPKGIYRPSADCGIMNFSAVTR